MAVSGNVGGREMAVVVEDGLSGRVPLVEVAGVLVAQQEIFVDEWHKGAGKSIVAYGREGNIASRWQYPQSVTRIPARGIIVGAVA